MFRRRGLPYYYGSLRGPGYHERMPGRANPSAGRPAAGQSAGARRARRREPAAPDLPASLAEARLPAAQAGSWAGAGAGVELSDRGVLAELVDGVVLAELAFQDLDLSGSEAVGADVDQCRFGNVSLGQARLRRVMFRDAEFSRCDLANLLGRECSMLRVAIEASRMTGLSYLAGTLRDVTFSNCRMDLASFAATRFTDVLFADCRLDQANFGDADLSGVRFERCDLSGAQFSGATMTGTRLTGCVLTGISGVTSLRGAIIGSQDALALAGILAGALGIQIADD